MTVGTRKLPAGVSLCPGCDAAKARWSGPTHGPDNPSMDNQTLCPRCDLTVFFVKVSIANLTSSKVLLLTWMFVLI